MARMFEASELLRDAGVPSERLVPVPGRNVVIDEESRRPLAKLDFAVDDMVFNLTTVELLIFAAVRSRVQTAIS